MNDMIDFSVALLEALSDFLGTPPVFYLFGIICLCFICKAVMILMGRR